MPFILVLLTLLFASFAHAATFFVDNTCANNGNGTAASCAGSPGGTGAWNTIKNALQVNDCAGMNAGDILEIKGDAVKDTTCEAGGNCYFEDNVNVEGSCHDIIIQNKENTHVVVDGTQDIKGSTWTSIGSGVYRCNTSGCSGDVGDAFAFRAWYKRTGNSEEQLDLIQTSTACNTSLAVGKMTIDTSNQSICVHLSDGSSPASAEYFRVPWFDPFLQAGADGMDNVTLRKNPTGSGTFRVQRYRKRGIESNAAANPGWVFDGWEWAYMMDRCIAYASGTEGAGNVQIRNNIISFCGQEGIRLESDSGQWVIENNIVTDIQTEPVFQRCSGIGSGCLPEFTDNGTGLRIINHQGTGGIIRGNAIIRMGGGMNHRARMINFEHDNKNIIVERNYLAHSSGLANTGAAIMWSGSFDADSNDGIIVRNNIIYDVDRCFWVQYGSAYDSQAGTTNYILNNHCVEFKVDGLKAEASGSAVLNGVFQVKNNIFMNKVAVVTNIIDVQSTNSTGWQTFQNNIFECDSCTANSDIIKWRGSNFERDEDCTVGVDCIDQMTSIMGGTYSGQKYGNINVDTSGGTEPALTISAPSEAQDAGQALTSLVPNDYTGQARPAVYDAGAYNIDGGAPPDPEDAPFDISVKRFPLSTTTGIQAFTFDDFSQDCTSVPCAAIFVVTRATTEAVNGSDAMLSVGFADGLAQIAVAVHDDTGLTGGTDSRRDHRTDRAVMTTDAAGIDGSAMFFDWTSQGLRIDISDEFPSAMFVTIVIMGGEDFASKVGTFSSNATVDGTTDVNTIGFLPEAVFLTSVRLAGTSSNTMLFTLGAAVNDGSSTQGSIGCYSQHGVTTSDPHALTSSLYAAALTDNGGADTAIQVGSWDSAGFTATTKVVGVAANFSYIAFKFGGAASTIFDIDTPTTVSTVNHSLSYRPLFAMVLGTLARAYDTDEADGDAGVCSVSFGTTNNQYGNMVAVQDAVTTTSTFSLSNDQGIAMDYHDGTCAAGSCFRGHMLFESDRLDINYTSVFTNAVRKWIGFTVEDLGIAGGGGSTGSARRGAGLMQ